jgi:hypothetical protein
MTMVTIVTYRSVLVISDVARRGCGLIFEFLPDGCEIRIFIRFVSCIELIYVLLCILKEVFLLHLSLKDINIINFW